MLPLKWPSETQSSNAVLEGRRGGQLLEVLWVIWLHWNEVLFRGRMASADHVVHDVEGPLVVLVSLSRVGRGGGIDHGSAGRYGSKPSYGLVTNSSVDCPFYI